MFAEALPERNYCLFGIVKKWKRRLNREQALAPRVWLLEDRDPTGLWNKRRHLYKDFHEYRWTDSFHDRSSEESIGRDELRERSSRPRKTNPSLLAEEPPGAHNRCPVKNLHFRASSRDFIGVHSGRGFFSRNGGLPVRIFNLRDVEQRMSPKG